MSRKLTKEEFESLIVAWTNDNVLGIESLFNVELTEQQKELVRLADNQSARVAVSSCTGSGKALCNYEKIHTPTGLKEIGSMEVGDLICNTYGSYSKVTGVFPQGDRDCYRVNFNNGTHVDCDLEHRWTVSSYHSNTGFVTLTLEEILNRGIYVTTPKNNRNPKGKRLKYYLPSIAPVAKEYPNSLQLDPYVLGVWLGDGGRKTGRITNIDQEVWDEIEKRGYQLSSYQYQTKTVYNLIKDLKILGISENYSYEKSIPKEYLEAPPEVRIEVLRGLMDTDGTVSAKGNTTYYSTSKQLAEDFTYLVRSLGGATKAFRTKKTTHRDCYAVHFQLHTYEKIFYIKRKQERVAHSKTNSTRVYIESVEYIGKREATCIEVDAKDSLYICENFIPTHNTATLAMLTFLYLMILPDCRILITSPSFNQLNRVFLSELNKWHRKMPQQFQDFFKVTRENVRYLNSVRYEQFASLVTASVDNKEALQGGHSENYIIMGDEGSGISEEAFDILLGTLSTGKGGRFLLVSNPVRSSGRFYQIFKNESSLWNKLYFSAYNSPNVNTEWIEEMKETYGEDSDLFRMRVLGQFPRVGVAQFISAEVVEEAIRNNLPLISYNNFPKIMGVDVARFGDDKTCFVVRQGPKILDIKTFRGLNTMEVASRVAEYNGIYNCAQICIDGIGVGAGTVDRCKDLRLPVVDVNVSNKSTEANIYCNLRSQLWGKMKEWLSNGADLPVSAREKETNLVSELTSMEYFYNSKMQLQLMSKKDLKRMGHESPDIADAISLTMVPAIYEVHHRSRPRINIKRGSYLWS